jgi:hypothetical protein
VILCSFNDVGPLNIPNSKFFDFIAGSGRGGLFDYWHDVSYWWIRLNGSKVFGPYTMKYSFANDSGDPLRDGVTKPRSVWVNEARRLAQENGVDLSPFYGVIAVVNAEADEGNTGGTDMSWSLQGPWGQDNWRWCNKCQGLSYAGNPSMGPCPAGGVHDHVGSGDYALAMNDSSFPGQNNWRWCNKCQGLSYAGNPSGSIGPCPAGGVHDHVGSGSYILGMGQVGYAHNQNNWKWCNKCQGLSYAGNPSMGPCPAGGVHDHVGSGDYPLYYIDQPQTLGLTFVAHETGHGYGLAHSWSANPDKEYGDPFDIMSALAVKDFSNTDYPPAGPGLNAPTLYKLGWLEDGNVFTWTAPPFGATVNINPLNMGGRSGFFMARMITPNHVYTVEFRQATGWDQGIGGDTILIHELRSNYTTGQQNWRWCNKCQGLSYAGNPSMGPCSAGGVHDHVGSGDYALAMNDSTFPGQNNWRWCNKCQGLSYAGNPSMGPCPAGGVHDHVGSGDYALAMNDSTFPGQNNWRWCNKCQGLSYAGNPSMGPCSAGGVHDHVGSGDYTLLDGVGGDNGQNNWKWCNKCQGLSFAPNPGACPARGDHDHTGSGDYTLANFGWDRTFLVRSLGVGEEFKDVQRGIRIHVDSIDSRVAIATITIN